MAVHRHAIPLLLLLVVTPDKRRSRADPGSSGAVAGLDPGSGAGVTAERWHRIKLKVFTV
jgi:hypothetical protein